MKRLLLFSVLLLALVAAPGARANQQAAALGGDGTAYMLKEGRYVDLFPEGEEAMAGARVLALDVMQPGGETRRVLVPGTEQTAAEISGLLSFENDSGTLYVLWRGWTGGDHMIKLARFAGGEWSAPLDLSETFGSAKGAPQLVVTRDTGAAFGDVDGSERTVLHVVWWEQEWHRAVETFYRPLIISNGGREELGPTVALNRMLTRTEVGLPVTPSLTRRPAVAAGRTGDSVIVSFADDITGTLASFELRALPVSLSALRDGVQELILANARQVPVDVLGDIIRAHITIGGYRFNPRDLAYLGDTVRQRILDVGHQASPEELGDIIRAHITIGGVRLVRERDAEAAPTLDQRILEVGDLARPLSGEPIELPHLISVTDLQELPISVAAPVEAETWVFPSPDGCRLTLAWEGSEDGSLVYQVGDAEGWDEAQTLTLTEELPLEQGLELVRNRATQN
jgi:hypothetical protein